MSGSTRESLLQAGRMADLPVQVSAPGDDASTGIAAVELSLDTLVRDIRRVYGLTHQISDAALLASLVAVTKKGGQRARWLAIFNSPLGAALSVSGCDLSTALGDILAALPMART